MITELRAWIGKLNKKERSAVLVLGTIGAAALLFTLGSQVGHALGSLAT